MGEIRFSFKFYGVFSLSFFVMIILPSYNQSLGIVIMKKFIINALGLSEDSFNSIASIETVNESDLSITLYVSPHRCPSCGQLTTSTKGFHIKKISHAMLLNRDTVIFYKCRRYLCKHCHKSFIESNPFTKTSSTKISSMTIINILNDLKPFNVTFSYIAKRYHLSVTKIIEIFDAHVQIKRKPLSSCLYLDEFYFNRHSQYKYAFMIMDFEKKVILDILESRHFSHLSDYFYNIPLEERSKVKYICTDMYKVYLSISSLYFKDVVHCIDPFHVVKLINDALNRVRKRILRLYSTEEGKEKIEYKLLKHRYKVLLKKEEKVNMEEYQYDYILKYHTTENKILELLLEIHPDIRIAYRLKETYLHFNDIDEQEFVEEEHSLQFDEIIEAMQSCGIKELVKCATTLSEWKKYILNSFVWINGRRISNGPIEGKNTYIKKMISNANGFRNFQRARNRFLYSQNLYEKYSLVEHKNEIKTKKGKKKNK